MPAFIDKYYRDGENSLSLKSLSLEIIGITDAESGVV